MHQLSYSQLAQHRENSTSAVSIYSPATGRTVQCFLKICNLTTLNTRISVFHDNGGTYDQSSAIVWQMNLNPGQILEVDHIFLQSNTENIAYSTTIANSVNATLYGVIR